jgi:hypothetical protein
MHKKLYASIAMLIICLALLASTFLIVPRPTQATGSRTNETNAPMISVSPTSLPDSSCVLINIPSNDPAFSYQACKVSLSANGPFNQNGVHWKMSVSAQFCYRTCQPYSSNYFGIVKSNGAILYGGSVSNDVLLIMPQAQQYGGYVKAMFTFIGPANKATVQFKA